MKKVARKLRERREYLREAHRDWQRGSLPIFNTLRGQCKVADSARLSGVSLDSTGSLEVGENSVLACCELGAAHVRVGRNCRVSVLQICPGALKSEGLRITIGDDSSIYGLVIGNEDVTPLYEYNRDAQVVKIGDGATIHDMGLDIASTRLSIGPGAFIMKIAMTLSGQIGEFGRDCTMCNAEFSVFIPGKFSVGDELCIVDPKSLTMPNDSQTLSVISCKAFPDDFGLKVCQDTPLMRTLGENERRIVLGDDVCVQGKWLFNAPEGLRLGAHSMLVTRAMPATTELWVRELSLGEGATLYMSFDEPHASTPSTDPLYSVMTAKRHRIAVRLDDGAALIRREISFHSSGPDLTIPANHRVEL